MNRYSVLLNLPSQALSLSIFIAFFSFDIICVALIHNDSVQTLATFTLVNLLKRECSYGIFFGLFLLGLLSMLSTGLIPMNLSFLIGFFLLAKALSFYSTHTSIIAGITIIGIKLSCFLLSGRLGPKETACTTLSIFVSLIIIYFSLKWSLAVKQGNRL